jgi:hypothetical protein
VVGNKGAQEALRGPMSSFIGLLVLYHGPYEMIHLADARPFTFLHLAYGISSILSNQTSDRAGRPTVQRAGPRRASCAPLFPTPLFLTWIARQAPRGPMWPEAARGWFDTALGITHSK